MKSSADFTYVGEGSDVDFASGLPSQHTTPKSQDINATTGCFSPLAGLSPEKAYQVNAVAAVVRASSSLTFVDDLSTIFAMLRAFLGDDAADHDIRVGALVTHLMRVLGVSEEYARLFGLASRLHDIGKLAIPDSILHKPAKLTDEEMMIVRRHPLVGFWILDNPAVPFFVVAQLVAKYHHEHWNGNGYSTGLRGEAIPALVRIVSLCDVYDCLLHARPYKPAWPQ
jgi:putative two-component system response regulator